MVLRYAALCLVACVRITSCPTPCGPTTLVRTVTFEIAWLHFSLTAAVHVGVGVGVGVGVRVGAGVGVGVFTWHIASAVENLCELAGLAGCSGHGVCEQSTGVAVCKCDPAYDGSMCGVCAAGHFVDESNACAQRVTQEVDISTTVAIILTALAGLQALVYVGAGCAFFRFRNECVLALLAVHVNILPLPCYAVCCGCVHVLVSVASDACRGCAVPTGTPLKPRPHLF